MHPPRSALLVVGSPRSPRSNSESLGRHMLNRLARRGLEVTIKRVRPILTKPPALADLLDAMDAADVVVLAFPVYVDALPGPLTFLLERAAERRARCRPAAGMQRPPAPTQRLVALTQCGFPEATHTEEAVAICERFAERAGYHWAGGLALGGGEVIGKQELTKAPAFLRYVRRALEQAADALAGGHDVPARAVRALQRRRLPRWLYRWMGSRSFRKQARAHGVADQLRHRPYPQADDESPIPPPRQSQPPHA